MHAGVHLGLFFPRTPLCDPFVVEHWPAFDEQWATMRRKWEEQFKVDINLQGRTRRVNQWVGNSVARDFVIIGPANDSVQSAFDFILDRARHLQLSDVRDIAPQGRGAHIERQSKIPDAG